MSNWTRLGVIAGLVSLALWIPFTRAVILFILPLGSGIDDLIFFAALFAAISFYVTGHWVEGTPTLERTQRLFVAIVVGAIVLVISTLLMLS